ncbi:hypothetical protein LR69_04706 [Geobacillus sp. BCO2]|nr:hypothetical protein LR69_04706 [Geobacillus sp. BCO2]
MPQTIKADLRYRIQSYDISLHGSRAVVRVALSQLDTNRPTFQLYHCIRSTRLKRTISPSRLRETAIS